MGRPDPHIWDGMLSYLRTQHPEICRHWFDHIEPLSIEGGTLKLLVHEQVQLRFLQRSCVDQFNEAAGAVTKHLISVLFVGEADAALEPEAPRAAKHARNGHVSALFGEMYISPDNSFDNFVVGPGSELAHAASKAVASKPGKAYNPLFIYGGVGLGKTHLLQAVCQELLRVNRSARLHYTSCNDFITAFNESVQEGRMSEFRHRFRDVDMLVIDDIHDLAKRDRTQEEFFHTFNCLHQAGKQIVMSSDTSPNDIPNLEERLVSRFNSGLVAKVEKPAYETRVAIVKRKAALRNFDLPPVVAEYIASRVDTNIRELEGAITKVFGLSQVMHKPVDLDLAKQAVGESISSNQSQQPTIQMILDTITNYYNIRLPDLLSKKRQKSIAHPRQVGMYLARKYTRFSLEEIGGYFGGRDHTTVMHAIKAVEKKRQADPSIDNDVNRIEDGLSGTQAG